MRSSRWMMALGAVAAVIVPFLLHDDGPSGPDAVTPAAAVVDDDVADDDLDDDDTPIALSAVPRHVMDAALAALPGVTFDAAETEGSASGTVYDLEGTLNGERWEVEVLSDGTVIEVERDD